MRIRSTPFQAEKTLTKDTVPVNVDAVLFWVVSDARKAIVEVEHYAATVNWAAQTTLRDVIGHTELVRMVADREQVDRQLQEIGPSHCRTLHRTARGVSLRLDPYQSGNRIRYKLLWVPRLHDKYADAVEAGNTFASSITFAPGFAATSASVFKPLGHSVFKATPER